MTAIKHALIFIGMVVALLAIVVNALVSGVTLDNPLSLQLASHVIPAIVLVFCAVGYHFSLTQSSSQKEFLREFFTDQELQRACDKRLRELAKKMHEIYNSENLAISALENDPGNLDCQIDLGKARAAVVVVKEKRDEIYALVRAAGRKVNKDIKSYL